jgi:hypothetical protein
MICISTQYIPQVMPLIPENLSSLPRHRDFQGSRTLKFKHLHSSIYKLISLTFFFKSSIKLWFKILAVNDFYTFLQNFQFFFISKVV